jgi:hypothetical protein
MIPGFRLTGWIRHIPFLFPLTYWTGCSPDGPDGFAGWGRDRGMSLPEDLFSNGEVPVGFLPGNLAVEKTPTPEENIV